jgi:EamA-like transporter family.
MKVAGHQRNRAILSKDTPGPQSGKSIPTSVVVGLTLTIILDTGVQILWKAAASAVPESAGVFEVVIGMLSQPMFYTVIVMFVAQFFVWMKVLARADLSFAQPITALSFVSVCALSSVLLHEHLGPMRLIGIGLILLGTWFISQTSHNTVAGLDDSPTHGMQPVAAMLAEDDQTGSGGSS